MMSERRQARQGHWTSAQVQAAVAEQDISWVRFAVIVFNTLLYASLLPHPRHSLAVTVALIALAYGTFVILARPHRTFPVLQTAAWTMATDSGLIILWIYATGGLASAFYPLWLLSLVAIAFRFPARTVVIATLVYALADLVTVAVSGDLQPVHAGAVAGRLGYILLVGALGAMLSQRWSDALRSKMSHAHQMARVQASVQEADRLRLLADASFEAIIVHREGYIIEANSAAMVLFGAPREELLGRRIDALVPADPAGSVFEAVPQDGDAHELWIQQPGAGRRRALVQSRAIEFQGAPARVSAFRDITEHHEAQQAQALAQQRQQEIERLQEIDAFRTRLINTAAHELNTPLTPIRLQFAVLRRQLQEAPRSVQVIERNFERLASLVHDLLDVARIDSGRARVEPRHVDLVPALQEIVETFQAAAMASDQQLEILAPDRLTAFADPERVAQVLTNLLSNAGKFTPPGGHICVIARDAHDAVRIEVADTGAGLDGEAQHRLFQPFSQLHDDPKVPGSGLGLFICKGLIEAMGGRMGADSDGLGQGSVFWMELPAQAPTAQETVSAPARP